METIILDGLEDSTQGNKSWEYLYKCEVGGTPHYHALEAAPAAHHILSCVEDVTSKKDNAHYWLCGKPHYHISMVSAIYCETGSLRKALHGGPHRKYED